MAAARASRSWRPPGRTVTRWCCGGGGTDHEDCDRFVERAQELVRGARSAEGLIAAVRTLRLREDPDAAWARGIALLYDPPGRPSYLSRDL
ncbi:hypothetical protein ACFV29_02845 [Streptomyces sp. NPDC059690]|uniref:VMAP-C domain-containing protein n=1 Tax=Streptomyces sp. NPDC059690 TaxID=3346907 RepID=UPI00368C2376